MKLSTDYSPFGKFTNQILMLTLVTAVPGSVMLVMGVLHEILLVAIIGAILLPTGAFIMYWGHRKQDIELFGEHQHWKDGLNLP